MAAFEQRSFTREYTEWVIPTRSLNGLPEFAKLMASIEQVIGPERAEQHGVLEVSTRNEGEDDEALVVTLPHGPRTISEVVERQLAQALEDVPWTEQVPVMDTVAANTAAFLEAAKAAGSFSVPRDANLATLYWLASFVGIEDWPQVHDAWPSAGSTLAGVPWTFDYQRLSFGEVAVGDVVYRLSPAGPVSREGQARADAQAALAHCREAGGIVFPFPLDPAGSALITLLSGSQRTSLDGHLFGVPVSYDGDLPARWFRAANDPAARWEIRDGDVRARFGGAVVDADEDEPAC